VKAGTRVADLTDPGELSELERVIAAAGPDLLVNTAGFAGQRPRPAFSDPTPPACSTASTSRAPARASRPVPGGSGLGAGARAPTGKYAAPAVHNRRI
jgi:hypothetical protein